MKKRFKLEGLDCAVCAAKMEDAVKKVNGVTDASVSFLLQKLTLEADETGFDTVMNEVVKVCKKAVPDCVIQR